MLFRIKGIESTVQIFSMLQLQWLLGNLKTQGRGPWTGHYMRYTCPNLKKITNYSLKLFIKMNTDIMYADSECHRQ